jgi:hypothetical protein
MRKKEISYYGQLLGVSPLKALTRSSNVNHNTVCLILNRHGSRKQWLAWCKRMVTNWTFCARRAMHELGVTAAVAKRVGLGGVTTHLKAKRRKASICYTLLR